MTWEAMTLDVLDMGDGSHVEYRTNGNPHDVPQNLKFYNRVGEVLNSLGQDGWEVVSGFVVTFKMAPRSGHPIIERYVLKRPAPDEEGS